MYIQFEQTTIDQITQQLSKGNEDKIRAGYLTGRTENDTIFIEGVYVPEQVSTAVMTLIKPEEQQKAFQSIGVEGRQIVGFVHYNAQFPAFESATTKESRVSLSQTTGSPNLGVIVNSVGEQNFYN